MPPLTQLGTQTPKTIILKEEMSKYSEEFIVNADVVAGQPVKLTTTQDGVDGVEPLEAGDPGILCIGIAMYDSKATVNENAGVQGTGNLGLVTVKMRACMLVRGIASGEVVAGPVKYDGKSSATSGDNLGVCKYKSVVLAADADALEVTIAEQELDTIALTGNAQNLDIVIPATTGTIAVADLGDNALGVGDGWAINSAANGGEIYVAICA